MIGGETAPARRARDRQRSDRAIDRQARDRRVIVGGPLPMHAHRDLARRACELRRDIEGVDPPVTAAAADPSRVDEQIVGPVGRDAQPAGLPCPDRRKPGAEDLLLRAARGGDDRGPEGLPPEIGLRGGVERQLLGRRRALGRRPGEIVGFRVEPGQTVRVVGFGLRAPRGGIARDRERRDLALDAADDRQAAEAGRRFDLDREHVAARLQVRAQIVEMHDPPFALGRLGEGSTTAAREGVASGQALRLVPQPVLKGGPGAQQIDVLADLPPVHHQPVFLGRDADPGVPRPERDLEGVAEVAAMGRLGGAHPTVGHDHGDRRLAPRHQDIEQRHGESRAAGEKEQRQLCGPRHYQVSGRSERLCRSCAAASSPRWNAAQLRTTSV